MSELVKEIEKKPKERIKELEDLAKERFIGKDGINMADYLSDDEYEELLELEEKLEEERKKREERIKLIKGSEWTEIKQKFRDLNMGIMSY